MIELSASFTAASSMAPYSAHARPAMWSAMGTIGKAARVGLGVGLGEVVGEVVGAGVGVSVGLGGGAGVGEQVPPGR